MYSYNKKIIRYPKKNQDVVDFYIYFIKNKKKLFEKFIKKKKKF